VCYTQKPTAQFFSAIRATGHLTKSLSAGLDDEGDVQEELEALQDVHNVASNRSKDTESNVAIVAHGIPG
jgi:hypothetical protein